MKKTILSLVLACFVGSVTVVAQQPGGGRPDQAKRMEQMVKDLGLTEAQTVEFKAAMESMKPMQNGSSERPSRETMEKKRTEMNAKMKKILTEEQYKKYEAMQSQGRQKK